MTSPDAVVPDKIAVVVDPPVCLIVSAVVVRSFAQQDHPCAAVNELPKVIVTVQVPVVPELYEPDDAPPTSVLFEHPDAVNVVPVDCKPADWSFPFPSKAVVPSTEMTPALARPKPTSGAVREEAALLNPISTPLP